MALSRNTPLVIATMGTIPTAPFGVLASSTVYEGSMVGSSSGYARALSAGDVFLGHARNKVVGTTSGAKTVEVFSGSYDLEVALASVAITDVGKQVFASADDTYTLTQSTNSPVGYLLRYSSSGKCIVRFQPSSTARLAHIAAPTTLTTALTAAASTLTALEGLGMVRTS